MRNFYTKKTEILHSEDRVIEGVIVKFHIVSVKRSWFWGLFKADATSVVSKYNAKDVPVILQQRFMATVKSIENYLMDFHLDESRYD